VFPGNIVFPPMSDVLVIDGGMGKELRRIGAPFRQPEWSALALIEAPNFVLEAHRNFIEAGAQLIITNNYAVVPFHLGDHLIEARGAELAALAGRLAREAADAAPSKVLVAGSLPPIFGSYQPDKFEPERASPIYEMLVRKLDPYVDRWVAETMSQCGELETIVAAVTAHESHKPLWAAFALPDQYGKSIAIRSGETIPQIVEAVGRHLNVVDGVLFNCSLPEQTGPALRELRTEFSKAGIDVAIGAYANAFPNANDPNYRANEVIHERRDELTAATYADIVDKWVSDGATIIGGCCDMYPEHIAELARRYC